MASSATRSRLSVLVMLLGLGGTAFWWYDGMVLIGPLLNGGLSLDLSALVDKVKASERAPESSDEQLLDEPPADDVPSWEGREGDDPLARFGSWTAGGPLRQVFLPTSPLRGEADGGPEDGGAAGRDAGGDPGAAAGPAPEHVVSVVMIADRERLAVVDGAVVAVGDQIEAGQVVEIRDGGLVVRTGAGLVSYLIGSPRGHALGGAALPAATPREQP